MTAPILLARFAELQTSINELANRATNPPPQDLDEVTAEFPRA